MKDAPRLVVGFAVSNRRGALRRSLRSVAAVGCAVAIFLVTTWGSAQPVRADETPFLDLEPRFSVQRRRTHASPGDILVDGLLGDALVLLVVGTITGLGATLSLVLLMADLHLRVIPRARRQALVALTDLDELRAAIRAINRFQRVSVGCGAVTLMVLQWSSWGTMPPLAMAVLGERPRTLLSGNLTSTSRSGVVDDHWIRTTHTDTHWVVTIRQPIVLSIPRSDPDLADVLMVLLYEGERTGATLPGPGQDRPDLPTLPPEDRRPDPPVQACSPDRGRPRPRATNHHLTPSMVAVIHGMILEDPFLGASEIRRRLCEQGHLQRADDIGLTTVTEAIKSVDYVAVRWKIEEMLKRGTLVPDYQKISQVLLEEMNGLAKIAGKKVGQRIIPIAQLLEPNAGSLSPPKVLTRSSQVALEDLLGPEPGTGTLASGWRATFIHYFTFGASYRELASFLGVHASTVYRRLVSIRSRLPALAKVLGPLRFSGIVGIDEKYILAPKPHREGKMARWAYLFIAIDPYSYDLLHAEVYPARSADCARAFLVGLKASGVLKPKAIVTDLWGPYESVIPEMYPDAVHHQCVFHAEQAASTMMRDKLGKEYRSIPEAVTLWKAIVDVFRAGCRRTLIRRYGKLVSQKDSLLVRRPDLAPVFESLARHFEKLANAYTDRRLSIPRTNNATELVFRCFTRRYKTLAGFETLETARAYVRLWSWYYRFRPFSPDANPRIRNKSPLQIAGYEVHGRMCLDLVMPPPQVEPRS